MILKNLQIKAIKSTQKACILFTTLFNQKSSEIFCVKEISICVEFMVESKQMSLKCILFGGKLTPLDKKI